MKDDLFGFLNFIEGCLSLMDMCVIVLVRQKEVHGCSSYFVLILLSFGGIILGVGALILLLNKGEKAEEIKALLESMWIDLKDLFVKFVRLYNLLEAFVKELIQREPKGIDEVAKAEDVTSAAVVSEIDEAAIDECIVEDTGNNNQS